ncbi:MAG TPA: trehalose-phosphatase [Chloroflexota bacterium]
MGAVAGHLHECVVEAERVLRLSPAGLFCDVDGTISRIVPHAASATIVPSALESLRRLKGLLDTVALVSGRPVAQLHRMVGDEDLILIGNHGLEKWERGSLTMDAGAAPFLDAITRAADCLREAISSRGVTVEEKGTAVAIHYRMARDAEGAREEILRAVERCGGAGALQVWEGRKVVELLPPVNVDKGSAVRAIVESRRLAGALYVGDDSTDLNAFRVLAQARERGEIRALLVAVSSAEAPGDLLAAADFIVAGVAETARMLRGVAKRLTGAAGLLSAPDRNGYSRTS